MNVYIVQCSSEDYDDCPENIRAFLDKEKATSYQELCESYVKKENDLREEYRQFYKTQRRVLGSMIEEWSQKFQNLRLEAQEALGLPDLNLAGDLSFSIDEMELY